MKKYQFHSVYNIRVLQIIFEALEGEFEKTGQTQSQSIFASVVRGMAKEF